MCSALFLTVFAVGVVAGAALTAISLATPAWRQLTSSSFEGYFGIIQSCVSTELSKNKCLSDWQTAPVWKQAAMGCLIASLGCCAAAFLWSLTACCMCCCKACLTPPLPLLAGLACSLNTTAVLLYVLKSGDDIGKLPTSLHALEATNNYGYSMWVGVASIGVLFLTTVIGAIVVKTFQLSPV